METNKINKVLLDVFLPQEDNNLALGRAKNLIYNEVLPELDAIFDTVSQDIRIDKVEIDLGTVSEQDFSRSLHISLLKYFNNYLTENKATENITAPGLQLLKSSFAKEDKDKLLFFLEKGYWPWNMQHEATDDILLFVSEYFKEEESSRRLFLLLPELPDIAAERAMILVFSEARLKKSFMLSLQRFHPLFTDMELILTKGYDKVLLQKDLSYYLFFKLLKSKRLAVFSDLKQLLEKALPVFIKANSFYTEKRESFWQKRIDEAVDSGGLKKIIAEIQFEAHQSENAADSGYGSFAEDEINVNEVELTADTDKQYETFHDSGIKHKSDDIIADEVERINIANAGMILLHLYLPYVFRELNWTNESNQFINARTQQKAIHFLQYLVTGKSRHMEHLLVLNKVFCGWPVHLPVMLKSNFSAKEKQAANDVMDSLKEHWPVLKNTSVQGLRESFINRNGIIQRKQNGFLLQIERKTIDVLLDSLPFGINTIKLPWNEYIIYTEW